MLSKAASMSSSSSRHATKFQQLMTTTTATGSLISPSLTNPLFYSPATSITSVAMRAYHGRAGSRENRMKQIYTCVPNSFETQRNDPFDYKLRSMDEIKK